MPTAGAMLQEAIRLLRFGFGGRLVDAAILAQTTDTMHANPFAARAVSVPVAMVFTFVSNGRVICFCKKTGDQSILFRLRFHP
jgi:putative flippase GtrA